MTPEERAKRLGIGVSDCGCWRAVGGICHEHQRIADAIREVAEEAVVGMVSEERMANAIRDAVAEERAACARLAREFVVRHYRGNSFTVAHFINEVNEAILARGS